MLRVLAVPLNMIFSLYTSIIIKVEKLLYLMVNRKLNKVFYNNVDNPLVIKDYKKVKKFVSEKNEHFKD